MKKLLYICFFFIFISCNQIEFVLDSDERSINLLYEKTDINLGGEDIIFLKTYIPMFFGKNKDEKFELSIMVNEEQKKLSVKSNQVTSNLSYELRFFYTLRSNESGCITFKKEILSNFTIMPKSSGFNYGTDSSLDKKYELAVTDNLSQFLSYLSEKDLYECI
tara:strand:- start:1417 stop:1905 length:489 start_codon:yes stop_codon:yes gene_type:complete